MFQAGHCDWQRPHSVQVVKSSRPFQVNCSTVATPNWSLSGSACSKSSGAPPLIIGRRPPSAGFAVPERLKKMLKNAATPIVMFSAIVMAQAMLTRIFTRATALTALSRVRWFTLWNALPIACETGAAQTGYGRSPAAARSPRIPNPQMTTTRIVYST